MTCANLIHHPQDSLKHWQSNTEYSNSRPMYALSPRQHVTKLDNDENIWNYWEFLRKKPTCFGDDITDSNHPASMTSTWFLETPCKPTSWTWTSWSDASCLRYLTRMVDMCPNSWCDICIYLLQYVSSLAGGKYYVAAILFEPRLFNPQHPSPVAFFLYDRNRGVRFHSGYNGSGAEKPVALYQGWCLTLRNQESWRGIDRFIIPWQL